MPNTAHSSCSLSSSSNGWVVSIAPPATSAPWLFALEQTVELLAVGLGVAIAVARRIAARGRGDQLLQRPLSGRLGRPLRLGPGALRRLGTALAGIRGQQAGDHLRAALDQ